MSILLPIAAEIVDGASRSSIGRMDAATTAPTPRVLRRIVSGLVTE